MDPFVVDADTLIGRSVASIPLNSSTLSGETDSLINLGGGTPLVIFVNGDTNPVAQENRRILEVTGQGRVSIPTDIASVELGIQVQGQTATEVQQQLAQRSTAVVNVLQNLGVQELQTTGLRLNPVYRFENNTQILTGFEASNTLQFELPTDRAGAAIDSAIQAGANLVQNISFTASDTALQEARLQALNAAVQDAQIQANTVLNTLQLTSGEIIDIDIISVEAPPPSSLRVGASEALAFDATTPVLGGPQTLEASVALDILYYPTLTGTVNTAGLLGI